MRPDIGLTIGKLAARAGCSVPTIRYYEQIGLLPRAGRRQGGQRTYGEEDVRRLTFVRRCRELGFSLDQVRGLARLAADGEGDCVAARDAAQGHLAAVHAKLRELRDIARQLNAYVKQCTAQCVGGPARECVILDDLSASGDQIRRSDLREM